MCICSSPSRSAELLPPCSRGSSSACRGNSGGSRAVVFPLRNGRVAEASREARSLIGIKRMIPSRQLTLWYFALAGALRSVGERGAFRFVHAPPETHLRLRPSALHHLQLLPPASSF